MLPVLRIWVCFVEACLRAVLKPGLCFRMQRNRKWALPRFWVVLAMECCAATPYTMGCGCISLGQGAKDSSRYIIPAVSGALNQRELTVAQ